MKKSILLLCTFLTFLLIINTVTAVPYTNSEIILEKNEQDKKIKIYNKISDVFKNLRSFRTMNINNNINSTTDLLSGVLFVLIGLAGFSTTVLIAFLGYISAYLGFSQFGVVLIAFATIIGITSLVFLVGGTVLIFI